MRITIDTEKNTLTTDTAEYALYSPEAFGELSRQWLVLGWNLEHWAAQSWMGRRMLQLPEDALRLAEGVWRLQPDVIIETGVYDGGTTLLFATLCRMAGRGRVIGVEKDVRAGVREALESTGGITLIEGDSAGRETIGRVRALVRPGERVFVFLDSDHSRAHVAAELEAYAPLASFVVAADTNLAALSGAPNGEAAWATDNPLAAVEEFLARHAEFERAPSPDLTYFPGGWLRRVNR
jgi:cephalosporin hydroxylase